MPMTIEYRTAQMYSHMIQHAQTYKCCQFLHRKYISLSFTLLFTLCIFI